MRCYHTPEGVWGWLLEKKDVSVEANQCLKDSELIRSFRTSSVVGNYRFKGEAIRQAANLDFVTHLELGAGDRKFRERFSA